MKRLFGLLAMTAAVLVAEVQAAVSVVRDKEDLDNLIKEMAMSVEESRTFDLGGGLTQRRATHMGNTLVQLHRLHFCA